MEEKKDKKILIVIFFIALILDQISKIIAYKNMFIFVLTSNIIC